MKNDTKRSNKKDMKIGILICGEVKHEVAKQAGQYWDRFLRFFANVKPDFEFTNYKVYLEEFPISIEENEAYIISGSVFSVNGSELWVSQLVAFIQECYHKKIRMVGICFGHQIIAKAMGGVVSYNAQGWGLGVKKHEVIKHCSWMVPSAEKINIIMSHQEAVVTLPPKAELLMISSHCPIVGYQIENLFVGFQGHPEMSSFVSCVAIEKVKSNFDTEFYENIMKSLLVAPDQRLLATWIVNFIKQD